MKNLLTVEGAEFPSHIIRTAEKKNLLSIESLRSFSSQENEPEDEVVNTTGAGG